MAKVMEKVMDLLGLQAEEEYEEYVMEEDDQAEEPWVPANVQQRDIRPAKDRSKNKAKTKSNLVSLRGGAEPQARLVIMEPVEFEEVRQFVDLLKSQRSIIVRLEHISREDAQRVVDFTSGATHALNGSMRKLGNDIFCFAPSSVIIEGDDEPHWFDLKERKQ